MNTTLTLALRRHSFNLLLGCAAGSALPALAQTAVAAAVASATTEMAAPAGGQRTDGHRGDLLAQDALVGGSEQE